MRFDSCRKYGIELDVKEYCKDCQQPFELQYKNCKPLTINPTQFQCPSKSIIIV